MEVIEREGTSKGQYKERARSGRKKLWRGCFSRLVIAGLIEKVLKFRSASLNLGQSKCLPLPTEPEMKHGLS